MARYRHLTQEERTLISHYGQQGMSLSQMAQLLCRHKSTLSREMKRNSNKDGYQPQTAGNRYLVRRKRLCLLEGDPNLRRYVVERLHEGFSPELIALRLKKMPDIENLRFINHESIYQWLYHPAQKREKLYKLLVQQHARRGRRKRVYRSGIPDRISIHERPVHLETRQEMGHWEADLMSFRASISWSSMSVKPAIRPRSAFKANALAKLFLVSSLFSNVCRLTCVGPSRLIMEWSSVCIPFCGKNLI